MIILLNTLTALRVLRREKSDDNARCYNYKQWSYCTCAGIDKHAKVFKVFKVRSETAVRSKRLVINCLASN